MEESPQNFAICPSCGTEFGFDDAAKSHLELRQNWINSGASWWSRRRVRPIGWNATAQLENLQPHPVSEVRESEPETLEFGTQHWLDANTVFAFNTGR